jgi:hypothetical protein
MARIRINLKEGEAASAHDNRVVAAQRIYESLSSPALVDGIYQRYGKELRLKARKVQPRLLRSPLEGASKPQTTASGTVQNSTVQNSTKERTRAVPVAGRPEHRGHAFCSERYCVPQQLHDEFVGRVGGAAISLPAWYLTVVSDLGDKPCTEQTFPFWKTRFEQLIVPQLRDAGAVDMLPPRPPSRRSSDTVTERMNARGRNATRSAPIAKRSFTKKE